MEAIAATITPGQKEQIRKFATEREITFSEALRRLLERALRPERKTQ